MSGLYITWHPIPSGKSDEDLKKNINVCRKAKCPIKQLVDGSFRVLCDVEVYKNLQKKFIIK